MTCRDPINVKFGILSSTSSLRERLAPHTLLALALQGHWKGMPNWDQQNELEQVLNYTGNKREREALLGDSKFFFVQGGIYAL